MPLHECARDATTNTHARHCECNKHTYRHYTTPHPAGAFHPRFPGVSGDTAATLIRSVRIHLQNHVERSDNSSGQRVRLDSSARSASASRHRSATATKFPLYRRGSMMNWPQWCGFRLWRRSVFWRPPCRRRRITHAKLPKRWGKHDRLFMRRCPCGGAAAASCNDAHHGPQRVRLLRMGNRRAAPDHGLARPLQVK